ncbi:hypothetical protein L6164_006284 [Bauhinia variegata]|uniref:Uncharacterized protein n=1 Tax=Bauhinia variegata TaxID=167791 RepID=A0ACB9PT60_BAUVA|nr:hypothetical protein L6164_006284 [Bauhinia variegata]
MTFLNMSSSESLTKVPDVSGIPNLEQLILDDCTSLVDIHESLGSLHKLVYFGAERCTELKILPSSLKFPSLGCLVLNGSSKLEAFPDLVGEMENLRIIEMEETAIKELPSWIVNVSTLETLALNGCSNLKELPRNIGLLQNLQLLDLTGCPQLRILLEMFRDSRQQNCSITSLKSDTSSTTAELLSAPCLDFVSHGIHSSYGFPLLETLVLSDCNLSEEDLHILSFFSNLTSLDISGNSFVTLPKCINRLTSLQELFMANCRNLQEIAGIPPNLERVDATSCTLLESHSSGLLLGQGLYKASKYEVIAPKVQIPMQFKHHSKGGSISFWVGQKFPRIALCFIFGLENKMTGFFTCEVQLSINGHVASNRVEHFLSVIGDHVWLYHQDDLMDLNTYLLHEQNHIEVSCEIIDASKSAKVTIKCCRIHEYQEDEEIDPNELLYSISSLNDGPESDCCSFPSNLRFHKISDEQQQQLSISTNPAMLQDDGSMVQEEGKTTAIMSKSDNALHSSKKMLSLHPQPLDDMIWDPMLLECQLKSNVENKLPPNGSYTTENKEVGDILAAPFPTLKAGTKAFIVHDEDSEHQKRKLNMDNVLTPEAPLGTATLVQDWGDQHVSLTTFTQFINPPCSVPLYESSFSLRKSKEKSWNENESDGAAFVEPESTLELSPPIQFEESIGPAKQGVQKGPSVLEYESKKDELSVITIETNTNEFDLSLIDNNMEAFYTALQTETSSLLPLKDTRDNTKLANSFTKEETNEALKILQGFLSKQFFHLLQPGSSTSLKTSIEYICSSSADDEISLGLKSFILQLSRDYTHWRGDYVDASLKLESTTADLSKLDRVEDSLQANMNQFSEFASMENELQGELTFLEERKKELEEQINALKASISMSAFAKEASFRNKRETFDKGRILKAERDELRKQRPRLRAEQESAIATQTNIEAEWSRLREQFDRILNIKTLI